MSHEVLTTAFEALTPLNRPIMVLALRGLFDIAEVATDAVDALAENRIAPIVASIDPDPFYDFTQERPQVEFDESDDRQILWPENEFHSLRFDGPRDLAFRAWPTTWCCWPASSRTCATPPSPTPSSASLAN